MELEIGIFQFISSEDMKSWSNPELINLYHPPKSKFYNIPIINLNIYVNNVFYLKNINKYVNIIPVCKKSVKKFETKIPLNVYISDNCIDWFFSFKLKKTIYHHEWLVSGEPLQINDDYVFYIINNLTLEILNYKISIKNFINKLTNTNINYQSKNKLKI